MDTQYVELARRAEKVLATLTNADLQAQKDLSHQIKTRPWTIDFEAAADTFNALYWVRNFWKAAYFLSYEYELTSSNTNRVAANQTLRVTFIGGGSGSDVLAFMVWFNKTYPLTKLQITVIDNSQRQLDTLKKLIKATADLIQDIEVTMTCLCMQADHWYPQPDSADVLILGHFLVENPEQMHHILTKTRSAVQAGGDIVILERIGEAVLMHAKSDLAQAGLTVHDSVTEEPRLELIEKNVDRLGATGVASHYLRAVLPDRKVKSELISKYFFAWRNQIIEPITSIFSPTARLDYKPGVNPELVGMAAIQDYWRSKPLKQSNVKVLIRNVSYTENVGVCAFEADFNTPIKHTIIKGALNFDIDPYVGKIRKVSGFYCALKTRI